ncbi:WD repeat-containing protein 46-like [Diadema antillarum]|uniref:WD repeat-containing protein 46-like n=1 Tax=Diadema antillarum TaxID=105358 RepID=UPI003A86EC3B
MSKKKPTRYFAVPPEKDAAEKQPRGDGEKEKRWKQKKGLRRKADPFPGPAPIPGEKLTKYKRGEKNEMKEVLYAPHKTNLKRKEDRYSLAAKQAARSELLLPEETGYLEADEGEETYDIGQEEIKSAVDIASATKSFELRLEESGPYRINFTRNGQNLLLGGQRGHLAGISWLTKKLEFEINVMDNIRDVQWLHLETMCAVAQSKYLYIYDNSGIELHCVKRMSDISRLAFLPYHFLLAGCNSAGYLHYLDVSVGKMVTSKYTKSKPLKVMTHNPRNAVIHLGHANGTVTLWSPNCKEPLVKMLCHKSAVRALAIDRQGQYMATSGTDQQIKIFDLRTYQPLQCYKVSYGAGQLSFSQRGLLAAACNNVVEVYKDCCLTNQEKPYMRHSLRDRVTGLEFCPYEDVLGVSHVNGYASLLIPGAGEPNFDGLEANPYRSKSQRREFEVRALLEKIQPEMISLDPTQISAVDKATVKQRAEERKELYGALPQEKFEPRYRMKGRSKAGNQEKRKQGVKEEEGKEKKREENEAMEKQAKSLKEARKPEFRSALDRFKK